MIELSCSWSRVCRHHRILSCRLRELWCCFLGVAWGLREGRGNHPCPLAHVHVAGQRHAWLNTWLTRCRQKRRTCNPLVTPGMGPQVDHQRMITSLMTRMIHIPKPRRWTPIYWLLSSRQLERSSTRSCPRSTRPCSNWCNWTSVWLMWRGRCSSPATGSKQWLPLSSQPSRSTCLSSPRAWLADNWNLRSTGESGIWSSTGSRAPRRKTKLWLAKCVGASRRRSYVSRTLMPQCLLPAIVSRLSAMQESSSVSWTSHSVTNGCRVPRTLKTITRRYQFLPTYHLSLDPLKMNFCRSAPSCPCRLNKSPG